jgi:hypothetical protein
MIHHLTPLTPQRGGHRPNDLRKWPAGRDDQAQRLTKDFCKKGLLSEEFQGVITPWTVYVELLNWKKTLSLRPLTPQRGDIVRMSFGNGPLARTTKRND